MKQAEFNHLVESLGRLSPEQRRRLRRELDSQLATVEHKQAAEIDLGSIGAMRADAELLDAAVAHAMKVR